MVKIGPWFLVGVFAGMSLACCAEGEEGAVPAASPAAAPAPAPVSAGAGAEFALRRRAMVEIQIAGREIKSGPVLKAMGRVPRHEFVPGNVRSLAYADRPLPIGHGQTISQPYIVAFMTEILDPGPDDRVLEIGTGSGYQAAVLGELVAEVFSIEIVEPLAERAAGTLARLGYDNVTVRAGDGYQGWEEHAPFDSVIVTCAPDHVPVPLVEQLKEGGRMIIPVGEVHSVQRLYLLRKEGGELIEQAVLPVRFVPMTGESEERGRKDGDPGDRSGRP